MGLNESAGWFFSTFPLVVNVLGGHGEEETKADVGKLLPKF